MLYKSTPETRLVYANPSAFVGIGMTLRMHNQTDTVWLTDDDIVSDSFQLIQSISEDAELNLGGCISSELTFEFDNSVCNLGESGNTFGNGCRIRLYRICYTDSGTTMTGIGYFFVESITENEFLGTYKVVAYDILHSIMNNMSLDAFKNVIWDSQYTTVFNDGTRWMQLGIFRQFLIQTTRTYYTDSQGEYLFDYESYISVIDESDYDLANDTQIICISAIDYSNTNAVELLRSIAELNCCFGYINSWGKYDYIAYASNNFTTEQGIRVLGEETLQIDQTEDDSFCKSFSRENYKTSQIVGVIVCSDNDNLSRSSGTVSDGSNYYKVQGNTVLAYSDSTTLSNMATTLNGLMNDVSLNDIYYPSEVEIELRPYVEVGDRYYSLYNTIDDNGNTTLKRFYGLVAKIIMGANFETLSIQGPSIRSNTETAKQASNSTSARAYVMQDKVERSVDATVVKDNDSYLYNALLSQTATDGTVLDKISTKWLHADRKADIKRRITFGVPTGDGYYKYTTVLGLDYITGASFLGQTPLYYSNLLYIFQEEEVGRSGNRNVGLTGSAYIEFTSEYPNLFLTQGFDPAFSPISPQNYGYTPDTSVFVNPMIEMNRRAGEVNEDILVASEFRIWHPKDEACVEKVDSVHTAEVKSVSLEFVGAIGMSIDLYSEVYDDIDEPTQHKWEKSGDSTIKALHFSECCEIDYDNTSVSTTLNTVTIRFNVTEAYLAEHHCIKFLRGVWESSGVQTGIQVDMHAGYPRAEITRVPTAMPLEADDIEAGAFKYGGMSVWGVPSTVNSTDGTYNYVTKTDKPYIKLRVPNYNYKFHGNITNLVNHQQATLKMIQTYVHKTWVDEDDGEWKDIDVELGRKPEYANSFSYQLNTDGYSIEQSKLTVSDTYDSSLGGYPIDIENSDSEMYEMYLQLLDYNSEDTEPAHFFESGSKNEYDDKYNEIDIIGSYNNLTGTESPGKDITIIGSGNFGIGFEDYEDGIEGVFLGNHGTGVYVDADGKDIVFYKNYSIYEIEADSITYTINFNNGTLTLTGSDGSTSTAEINILSYTLERTENTYNLILTDSDNNSQTVSIEPLWADDGDITSSINEIFNEGDIELDIAEGNVILDGTQTTVTINVESGTIGG